jgi:hypothetical protein
VFHNKFIPLCFGLKELSMLPDYMQPIIFLEVRVINHFVYKLNLNVNTIVAPLFTKLIQVADSAIMVLSWLRWHILLFFHWIFLTSPVNVVLFFPCVFLLLFKYWVDGCGILV